MEGRIVDNANFLHIAEIGEISDGELYNSLLNEFPSWISDAKEKGILKMEEQVRPSAKEQEKKKTGYLEKLFNR